MAYPYYTPQYSAYQPYQISYPQQPVMPQPNYQAMQQPSQPQTTQPQSSIIWISGGEKEAAMYPVAPNNAVTLWSTVDPVVYLKKADATGKPTLTIYDLVERQSPDAETSKEPQIKAEDFATKADLGTVAGIVKGLATDIEQIKTDVYGIAGKSKKAPPRKQKEEEEDDD